MAVHNVPITYPSADAPRIMAALKAKAATEENPNPNNGEALAWLSDAYRAALKDIVLKYEREEAVAAAVAAVTPPDVT